MNRPPKFPFRLAAIDVDDTLVGPEKEISPANRAAVEQLSHLGCRVVLASGRRHANMKQFYTSLGLNDFAISCQGARVEHVLTGEIIHLSLIDSKNCGEIIAEGIAHGLSIVVWQDSGIYAPMFTNWVEAYRSETGRDPISSLTEGMLGALPAEKIVWLGEPVTLMEAKKAVQNRYAGKIALTEAHDWCLEFSALAASKADALATIAARGGVPREAVLAFGDGYNDVSMLRWAGVGVAMAHGRTDAREAARFISAPGEAGTALSRAVHDVAARYRNGPAPV